jgi:hypothetical protein
MSTPAASRLNDLTSSHSFVPPSRSQGYKRDELIQIIQQLG